MELTCIRIKNFRSIDDSGDISADKITALVGRNESGKSNLLLALATLNPAGGRKALNKIKDFPRGRRLEECKDDTPVVVTRWKLSKTETDALAKTLRAYGATITEVRIGRGYAPTPWVGIDVPEPIPESADVESILRRLEPTLTNGIAALVEPHKANSDAAWQRLKATIEDMGEPKDWATEAMAAAAGLRARLGEASITLGEDKDKLLAEFENKAKAIDGYDTAHEAARAQIIKWLPAFIYVSEFPELNGHQNLDQFINQRGQDSTRKEAEDNFEKMAKVAGFDPKALQSIREDHETRNQLLNRAGAVVTQEIRRLWNDRPLKVRYHLDGPYLDTLISDPNAVYDVEVNLDERSRGFRWFFSFYITFAADTQGGNADGAILLLDEPGLHLHAKSQEDLLNHLRANFKNQIIYTTHSPFMIPPNAINIVRTVQIHPENGTSVSDTPTGDSRTLFPLQAALGYHISQTLFVGHSNLIVEGVTDFWILSAINGFFTDSGTGTPLPKELTITPVGGAGKISYMTALLASQELKVLVLLDNDRAGRDARNDLVTNKLIRDSAIIFVTEGLEPKPSEADIEDLLDPSVYDTLVSKTYRAELAGKTLALKSNVPRIVKRYEEAFAAHGIEFNKTRPAREFITAMGVNPTAVLPAGSAARFGTLFKAVRERYERIRDR